MTKTRRLYLAGGWFSADEARQQQEIYELIRDNFGDKIEIFNPKLDNNSNAVKTITKKVAQQIFDKNIEELNASDIVVALCDYKDVGTMFEIGYSYAAAIPVVLFAELLEHKKFNVMLACAGDVALSRIELVDTLKYEISRLLNEIEYE